jgi:hypothetical protein
MTVNRPVQILACTAFALALNAAFTWAALESTATVPPLRAWQAPAALPDEAVSTRVALDAQPRALDAALVQ